MLPSCACASISRPFQVQSVLSLSLTLHSLENLVIAHYFPNFSAHVAKFSQLKFCKYSENITSREFPALRYINVPSFSTLFYLCLST